MAKDVYVLGIDQSTQGTKALLFDTSGKLVDIATLPHRQIINEKGYVEHDLNEIAKNVVAVVKALVDKDPKRADLIATVGLSVQRETVAAWQKSTLKPLYNAIVWQCARGAEFVSQKEVQAKADDVRAITGLELSEYFSAAKITWLVDNVKAVQDAISNNDLSVQEHSQLEKMITIDDKYYLFGLNQIRVYSLKDKKLSIVQTINISE